MYEVRTHLTILMRDGSFPLSHAICRSTRIRTGVNFSSPLCKSGMFYHYTMDLLRSAWLESNQHFHLPITRSNLIRIEGYTPFRGQGGSRTHDGTFVHQINSLDFSATKATHPFCSPCGIRTHILALEERCPVQLDEGAIYFVPKERLELSRPFGHRFLRPACLPFHHLGLLYSPSDSNRYLYRI